MNYRNGIPIIYTQSDIILDNPGASANSPLIYFRGDNAGNEVEAALQLLYGADPYLRISVDDDGTTPALTAVVDFKDTVIPFSIDNTVDIGVADGNRPKDYWGAGNINLDTDTGLLRLGASQDVVLNWNAASTLGLGTVSAGNNFVLNATEGTELSPALTGASTVNWTFAGTYTTPLNSTIEKAGDGTDTITPTAATTIVVGTTYKVVITTSACTVGGFSYTLGGVTGTSFSTATTVTDYVTASTTGKLIITPTATSSRFVISSISFKALTDATGDLTVRGNLTVNSPATFNAQMLVSFGTPMAPQFSFIGDTDTGFYRSGNNEMSIALGGANVYDFGVNNLLFQSNSATFYLGSSNDLVFGRSAANILQIGANDATATAQKIKGPDSSTALAAGGNLSLQGGTPGAGGVYGSLILQPDGGNTLLSAAGVAHGMTTITPTDAYGTFAPISTTIGGLDIYGLTDLTQDGALRLTGIIGAADPTDTHTAVHIRGGKSNGTGWQALGAAETVFRLTNYDTDLVTVLGNGDVNIGTGAGTPTIYFLGSGNTNYITKSSTNVLSTDAVWQVGTGSTGSPSLAFFGDTDTGMWRGVGDNGIIHFSTNATEVVTINGGNVLLGTSTYAPQKLTVWDGGVSIQNTGTLGSEKLTEGNFTNTTKWTAATDFHLEGGITTVTLAGGGSGYTALDSLTVVQAGGSGGTVRVDTVDGSGVILTFTVTAAGTSYYVANSLSVTGGSGTLATFNITVIANTAARYVHSAGSGTLTQATADLVGATNLNSNRWYKFVYTVSGVTAGCTATIPATVALTAQTLTISAATTTLYFLSAAASDDFVISVTSTGGGFTMDTFSLMEIQGGDLYLGGNLYLGKANTTTTNAYVVGGGQAATTGNTGWIPIYVNGTLSWIPYWSNATP